MDACKVRCAHKAKQKRTYKDTLAEEISCQVAAVVKVGMQASVDKVCMQGWRC